jgi:hypothetical protein
MEEVRDAYRILVRRTKSQKTLRRTKRKSQHIIKIENKEKNNEDVDFVHVAQDKDKWRASEQDNGSSGSIKQRMYLLGEQI